jgi:hypothetical protein
LSLPRKLKTTRRSSKGRLCPSYAKKTIEDIATGLKIFKSHCSIGFEKEKE